MALELKNMYDLYGACAGRMADLLDWLDDAPTLPAARGSLPSNTPMPGGGRSQGVAP